ncbi:MAG: ShlB/FhaC/HecB family hemolysin secretion/activation protein [Burkholderiales bacterium]
MATVVRVLCAGLILGLGMTSAQAQTPPSPSSVQEQQRQSQEYIDLQKRLREPPPAAPEVIDKTQRPAPGAPEGDVRIRVNQIVASDSRILKNEEIRIVTSRYEGREVGIAELFSMVDEINALYKAKGCLTCRAFLPAQTVEDGKIEVRLVEAKAQELQIEGNASTSANFLKRRISTRPGDLFDVGRVTRDLGRINATTDLQTAVELKPGSQPGTVVPLLRVAEPVRYGLTLFTDNAGPETVGEYRMGLSFTNASVFGLRDAFSLSIYGAQGTAALLTSYSVPVHPSGTRIGLAFDYSRIKVIRGPFEPLDINGDSHRVGLDLTQPLIAKTALRVNALAQITSRHSVTNFGDVKFSELDVLSAGLGFDLQSFNERGVWYTRNIFTMGSGDSGAKRDFSRFNADVYRVQTFTPAVSARFRFSMQWSGSHPLPSTEQFQAGGVATVRGYREGLLAADEGGLLGAELEFPVASDALPTWLRVRGFGFLDTGCVVQVRNGEHSVHAGDCLYGTGGGVSFAIGNRLTGKLSLGVPLRKPAGYEDDWRIDFSLQALLF